MTVLYDEVGRNMLSGEVIIQPGLYTQAEEEFIVRMEQLPSDLKPVQKVYRLLADFDEQYKQTRNLACTIGCSHCCSGQISCTGLEMEYIIDYLKDLIRERLRPIKLQVRRQAEEFNSWWQMEKSRHTELRNIILGKLDPKLDLSHLRYRACLFLSPLENKCLVYQARPIICRSKKAITKCNGINLHLTSLLYDQMAIRYLRKAAESTDQKYSLPLVIWTMQKPFNGFFW